MNGLRKSGNNSAVVFAYHDIGVRCLQALCELGVAVKLVVTHQDEAAENIWFASVAETAARYGIPCITPANPNDAEVVEQIRQLAPDLVFSFYYRHMMGPALLAIPRIGAFNLHGSLLPRYRGRVPVNWAIIHGETESGVSLHRMVSKPDAGNLVSQKAVPILGNDTAYDVFQKLKCAAESVMLEATPKLLSESFTETVQDLRAGSYFSGRKPEDGRIDWSLPASSIHNLIRAVAPPYPGAFFDMANHRVEILGSHFQGESALHEDARLYVRDGNIWADCVDGKRFKILRLRLDQVELDAASFAGSVLERVCLGEVFVTGAAPSNA